MTKVTEKDLEVMQEFMTKNTELLIQKIESTAEKLDAKIEARADRLDAKIDAKTESIFDKLDSLDKRVERLEGNSDKVTIAVIVGAITILIKFIISTDFFV